MDRRFSPTLLIACLALTLVSLPAFAQSPLFNQAAPGEGGPMGGPYVPPGSLYDNQQSNGSTSLASQDDASGSNTARSADDFTIDGTGCESGTFDITQIRIQMVQQVSAPQPFAIDLFNDDGTGNLPESGINPFATYPEQMQTLLGPFGASTNIFEATFDTTGLQLDGDTVYWISGYGANGALNVGSFNNFFAASDGAPGTTANGVIIAPGAGVPDWTPVENVLGPPPLAFSFAIDGECFIDVPGLGTTPFDPAIPTLSPVGIGLMAGVLALLAVFVIARRRG